MSEQDSLRIELAALSDEELIAMITTDKGAHDSARLEIAEEILKSRDYNIEYEDTEEVAEEEAIVEAPKPVKAKKGFFGSWASLLVLAGLGLVRTCLKGLDAPGSTFTLVLSLVTLVVAVVMMFREE